jgi:hypothetical protein
MPPLIPNIDQSHQTARMRSQRHSFHPAKYAAMPATMTIPMILTILVGHQLICMGVVVVNRTSAAKIARINRSIKMRIDLRGERF